MRDLLVFGRGAAAVLRLGRQYRAASVIGACLVLVVLLGDNAYALGRAIGYGLGLALALGAVAVCYRFARRALGRADSYSGALTDDGTEPGPSNGALGRVWDYGQPLPGHTADGRSSADHRGPGAHAPAADRSDHRGVGHP